jgi:hypothetical protein
MFGINDHPADPSAGRRNVVSHRQNRIADSILERFADRCKAKT